MSHTGSDKDHAWQNWGQAEIRRLASREAQLLQELGLTMGDPALEPARVKLTPPWAKVEVLSSIEIAHSKAVAAQMFTGRGGAGSEGEFYDVQITNRGFRTDQARSTPMFGNPNAKVVDRRKFYDGKEFETDKLGGYGHLRYDVQCAKTGTPRDVSKSAKAVPNFGPKGQHQCVVDRKKFYTGYDDTGKRTDQAKLLGSYGPGWYDVRVNNKGNAAAVENGTHDREPLRSGRQGLAGVGFGRCRKKRVHGAAPALPLECGLHATKPPPPLAGERRMVDHARSTPMFGPPFQPELYRAKSRGGSSGGLRKSASTAGVPRLNTAAARVPPRRVPLGRNPQ